MRCLALVLTLVAATAALADDPPFTAPQRYVWISKACPDWNCVMSELAVSQGSPTVLALATTNATWPWVVLKRMEAGSIYLPEEDVFGVETFAKIGDASLRFQEIPAVLAPMLVSAQDGSMLVTSLRPGDGGRKRSVRH